MWRIPDLVGSTVDSFFCLRTLKKNTERNDSYYPYTVYACESTLHSYIGLQLHTTTTILYIVSFHISELVLQIYLHLKPKLSSQVFIQAKKWNASQNAYR